MPIASIGLERVLFAPSFQVFIYSNEIEGGPGEPFSSPGWTVPALCLLIGEIFQPLHHFCGLVLDFLHYIHIFLVLGSGTLRNKKTHLNPLFYLCHKLSLNWKGLILLSYVHFKCRSWHMPHCEISYCAWVNKYFLRFSGMCKNNITDQLNLKQWIWIYQY